MPVKKEDTNKLSMIPDMEIDDSLSNSSRTDIVH